MNNFNAFTQSQYPEKFTGLLHVDEAVADSDEMLAELDRAHLQLGLKGVYYSQDFSRHGYDRNVDHSAFAPFWDKVAATSCPSSSSCRRRRATIRPATPAICWHSIA